MSAPSYFDALVARARGEAPLLTPRRSSRFEPGSPAGEPTLELEERVTEPSTPPAPRARTGQIPPVSRETGERGLHPAPEHAPAKIPGPATEGVSPEPRAGSPTRFEPFREAPPRDRPSPADDRHPAAIEREVRETRLKEVRVERILPAAPESEPNRRLAPEREREITTEKPPAGRDGGSRLPELDGIDQRLRALERNGADGHAETPAPSEPMEREVMREPWLAATSNRVVAPVIRSAARTPSPPAVVEKLAPAASDPETVVQVSIGRIDVRASAPDKPVRAGRPAKPRLSLDDYLRQREGR